MRRYGSFLPVVSSLAATAALVLACSSQAAPVGQGGQCELATDCADGLICAPAKGASACPCTCTSNLNGIQQLPPTPDAGQGLPAGDASANDDVQIPTSLPEAAAGD